MKSATASVATLLLLLPASTACASQLLRTFTWETAPAGARVERGAGAAANLVVESPGPQGVTLQILVVEAPAITASRYSLSGRVACAGVEGQGYLEMWSVFADGERYFSRTLSTGGPLAALSGDSTARPFVLPFFMDEGNPAPVRLELNLVLPGPGKVTLGPLELRQFERDEDPLAAGAWWQWRGVGLLGAGLGTLLGLLGAAIGILGGTGRAPRLARRLALFGCALGVALLLAGLTTLALRQPFEITWALLLCGLIAVPVFGMATRSLRQREQEAELRRMRALDTR